MKDYLLPLAIFSLALSILIAVATMAYLHRYSFPDNRIYDRWERIIYTDMGFKSMNEILQYIREKK